MLEQAALKIVLTEESPPAGSASPGAGPYAPPPAYSPAQASTTDETPSATINKVVGPNTRTSAQSDEIARILTKTLGVDYDAMREQTKLVTGGLHEVASASKKAAVALLLHATGADAFLPKLWEKIQQFFTGQRPRKLDAVLGESELLMAGLDPRRFREMFRTAGGDLLSASDVLMGGLGPTAGRTRKVTREHSEADVFAGSLDTSKMRTAFKDDEGNFLDEVSARMSGKFDELRKVFLEEVDELLPGDPGKLERVFVGQPSAKSEATRGLISRLTGVFGKGGAASGRAAGGAGGTLGADAAGAGTAAAGTASLAGFATMALGIGLVVTAAILVFKSLVGTVHAVNAKMDELSERLAQWSGTLIMANTQAELIRMGAEQRQAARLGQGLGSFQVGKALIGSTLADIGGTISKPILDLLGGGMLQLGRIIEPIAKGISWIGKKLEPLEQFLVSVVLAPLQAIADVVQWIKKHWPWGAENEGADELDRIIHEKLRELDNLIMPNAQLNPAPAPAMPLGFGGFGGPF